MPLLFGVVFVATHWITFRKIQVGAGRRAGLLVPNAILLVVILLGVLFLPPNPSKEPRPVLRMVLLTAIFLIPLASNILYLSFKRRSSVGTPHGS
jgi:RsiW-degrading membrane proteinase PrsW (M82 family)